MPNSKSKVLPLPVGEVIKALSSVRYNKSKHSSWTRFNVGKFIIDDITYLYMTQNAKTPAKLRNYCRKDGDFIELTPEKSIKEIIYYTSSHKNKH